MSNGLFNIAESIGESIEDNRVPVKGGKATPVGTSSTTIAHGLGRTPIRVLALPYSDCRLWQSAPADATNIYLQASVATQVDWEVK